MVPTGFSSEKFAPADQFEAWRAWFSPVLDVVPKASTTTGFAAANRVWDLGGLVVSCVSAPPVSVLRTKSNIARAPVDHWVLSCSREGATTIQTSAALLKAPPKVPFVWSLGETSESHRPRIDRIQIFVPRDMVPDIAAELEVASKAVLDTPLGVVLGEYLLALEDWMPGIPSETLPRLGKAVGSMIEACLAPSDARMEIADDEFKGFRAERVRLAVRKHLKSPSLGPAMLCKAVSISRSNLYRLFEHSGGIVHYIQRQRLLHARALLSNPLNRKSIATISEELCFADPSSFSRAFRREFGCSPKDMRLAAEYGRLSIPASRPRREQDVACFADLLRSPDATCFDAMEM